MSVIAIKLDADDLGSKAKNELRYRMQIASWKEAYRAAEARNDWYRMGELNVLYCLIAKP